MNRCLKMELARAFANRRMLPPVSFGLVLSIWHYFIYIFPLRGLVSGEMLFTELLAQHLRSVYG